MATLGVEMEFKTSPDGVKRYQQALKDGAFDDLPYSMSCDHAQLIEVKSPITKVKERDFDRDVIEMRERFTDRIRSLGLPFTYYGVHMSVWDFAKPKMMPIIKLCGSPPWALIMGFLPTHPRNVYKDPFIDTGPPVHHSIFICDHDDAFALQGEVFQEEVDAISWQKRKRIFHLVPDLKQVLDYGPVPGGSLRVQRASRLELILGWLPEHVERRLFEALTIACIENGLTADPDEKSITLIAKRGHQVPRLATSYLSGYTYKEPSNPPPLSEKVSGSYLKVFDML
jgi:hypothetical protein